LTSVEQSLVEHVSRGELLDLAADDEAVDEAAMRSWGESRTCRASVIRDILRGRLAAEPDPHGLRLRGVRITGQLDLENLTTDVNLELEDCLLEEGLLARGARLASVSLAGCQFEHPAEPPLDGTRLTCSLLNLDGARVIGHSDDGAVSLPGARIGGSVGCTGAELRNDSGPALNADNLQVDQDVFLRDGFTAIGSGDGGAVNLRGTRIGGQLNCTGAELRNDSGPALAADSLQVGRSMFLRDGFTATGSGDTGAVCLTGGHVSGQLNCSGAELRNDSGSALYADSMEVGQALFLRDGFTATGGGDDGAVNLSGTHIGGQLDSTGAELRNDSGPALNADSLQVDQAMFLQGVFAGGGLDGAVRLLGARVGGQLDCSGAELGNDSGSALYADSMEVGQALFLRDGFTATGSGDTGAVRLLGAHVGGNLECDQAKLRNDSGPALNADNLQVDQDMYLTKGFTATSSGNDGAVRLPGAHIGGQLACTGEVRNDSGPALAADGLKVGQDMHLTDRFTAIGGGEGVAVVLNGARVGGAFLFDPACLEHKADSHRRLRVDGLTYTGVPQRISARAWLDLLRNGTPGYAAQPYQQLAAGYRALVSRS
jgi:hypothetical protein